MSKIKFSAKQILDKLRDIESDNSGDDQDSDFSDNEDLSIFLMMKMNPNRTA